MVSQITALPTPPSRQDPDNFSARGDAFLSALPGFVSETNNLATELNGLVQNFGYAATSVTSNTVDTSGPKTFVVEPGLSYAAGQFVLAAHTAAPENYIVGQITSYDDETGELVLSILKSAGAGTYVDWSLSLTLSVAEANFITAEADRAEAGAQLSQGYALAAAAAGEIYDSTADALSSGVYSLGSLVVGSGGTDGTFALAISGGGGSGAAGWFTVVSGAVSAYQITSRGRGYTSVPTVSFAASAGLSGASATAVLAQNRPGGTYYLIPLSDGSGASRYYRNDSGTPYTEDDWVMPNSRQVLTLRSDFTQVNSANLFPAEFLLGNIISPPLTTRGSYPDSVVEWVDYDGYKCLRAVTIDNADVLTYLRPLSDFGGASTVSVGITIQYATDAGGPSSKISIIQYDDDFVQLDLVSTTIPSSEITTPTRYVKEAVVILGSTAYIAFDITNDERETYYRDLTFRAGVSAEVTPPQLNSGQQLADFANTTLSKNVFKDPFFKNPADHWTLGSGANYEIVDVNGVSGFRVGGSSGESAVRIDYPASLFENTSEIYFRANLIADAPYFNYRILAIAQFDESLTELSREEINYSRLVPKDGIYLSVDNITLDPLCSRVSVYFYGSDTRKATYIKPCLSAYPISFFSTDYYLEQKYWLKLQDWAFESYSILPDVLGLAPTCTGFDRITRGDFAGCWLVGSNGREDEDASPVVYIPNVFVLSPDFRQVLATYTLGYEGNGPQGIAVDTSGGEDTFWAATQSDGKLRHYNLYGNTDGEDAVEITGDVYDWDGEHSGLPNHLSYDPVNDALWCGESNSTTARLISCNPAASPRQIDSVALETSSPDQSYYLAETKELYYTAGSNGTRGKVYKTNVITGDGSLVYQDLIYATAIEGIYIDADARLMFIANNGKYHKQSPALNIILTYKIP